MDSPFDVLGIDPDADEAEIDRAYRRRVIETHPDQGGTANEFRLVKSAYEEIQSGYTIAEDDDRTDSDAVEDSSVNATDVTDATDATDADAEEAADWQATASAHGDGLNVSSRVEYLDFEVIRDEGWSLDDENLFEKAADADLDTEDYGKFLADPSESLLEAAEERGFAWPFACRGGACANCAVAVWEGELATPNDHILPSDLSERGFQLSCISTPVTETVKIVFNVKHLPELEELLLPADRFNRAHSDD